MIIDNDVYDMILSLMLKSSMDNYSIIDARRVRSIIEDAQKIVEGKLWMTFDKWGNLVLMTVEDSHFIEKGDKDD